jgi:hypothetical protein
MGQLGWYRLQVTSYNRATAVPGIAWLEQTAGYKLHDNGIGIPFAARGTVSSPASRMALRPIQPPIQRVLQALSPGLK